MSYSRLDYQKQLKKDVLYEIIATTFSTGKDSKLVIPNASCMGIRLNKKNKIEISPFHVTTTYRNLKENGYIVINFVDDIYLYALAALKTAKSLIEFPLEYYLYTSMKNKVKKGYHTFPCVKKSWGILIGKITNEVQLINKDKYGESLRSTFELEIFYNQKYRDSFKYFNRAENLALETIVLATRMKVAKELNNNELFDTIYEKIIEYKENVERFSKNKNALKVFDLVSDYITNLKD